MLFSQDPWPLEHWCRASSLFCVCLNKLVLSTTIVHYLDFQNDENLVFYCFVFIFFFYLFFVCPVICLIIVIKWSAFSICSIWFWTALSFAQVRNKICKRFKHLMSFWQFFDHQMVIILFTLLSEFLGHYCMAFHDNNKSFGTTWSVMEWFLSVSESYIDCKSKEYEPEEQLKQAPRWIAVEERLQNKLCKYIVISILSDHNL